MSLSRDTCVMNIGTASGWLRFVATSFLPLVAVGFLAASCAALNPQAPVPATTSEPVRLISPAELTALQNQCGTALKEAIASQAVPDLGVLLNEKRCGQMVGTAVSSSFRCDYTTVQHWIGQRLYLDDEWPIVVDAKCRNFSK